ncbi:MAG: hypothetical protein CVU86_08625 [Firmicutes bacterium HGW-Firmicutes-11]|jgi:hypothetical protein|nr:MAG: hypothetical protein CVU86_08625 [Firmicutes bacterium HGW-Firmicutes-11]
MKYVKRIIAAILFLLLFLGVFSVASDLLMHKQIEGRWNMTAKVKGFYTLEPGELDVVFLGSSHMYCSVDPAVFAEETGLNSYIFATQQQPLWITYHYMVEALETQQPELLVVEIHMSGSKEKFMDEGTNHSAIDPIPLSVNKVEMIRASVPEGEQRYYLFHLMKYHDRWEELKKEDYQRIYETETDPDRGFVRLTSSAIDLVYTDLSDVKDTAVANEKNNDYLNKMMDLAEQRGVRLVLFKAPSNATVEEKQFYNGVASLVESRGVDFIDYNDPTLYEEVGLILESDFYDQRHLNENGMKKFVAHFGPYLKGLLSGDVVATH